MTDEPTKKQPNRFTLESIYQITQIIAFVAIIASLFAIYSQINQQNQISRFNATRDLINQFNDLNSLIITDASLRQTMHKETPLSDDEQRQIYPYVASRANIWASTQWAYDTGQIAEADYQAIVIDVRREMMAGSTNLADTYVEYINNYTGTDESAIFEAVRDYRDKRDAATDSNDDGGEE